ncbi:MAG: N-acetylglucosamine-6-phosphate deacetylase [Eubacteriales bacterium]|nr:N-acetylglucosamine-6-phosphate deacetylase [Eubacteriales bacterium]
MKKILVKELYTGNRHESNKVIVFSDKIEAILNPQDAASLDAKELPEARIMTPGFIDIHIHGGGGADTMDGTPEALDKITEVLPRSGCTSFLATTMTQKVEVIERALENVKTYRAGQREQIKALAENPESTKFRAGAEILGVHLEGPFISPKKCGAQDPQFILKPNRETTRFLEPFMDLVKLITVAPEEDDDYSMIRAWSQAGIVCSMGHTNCTFEEANGAFMAGLSHVTHCFNAMTPLHHREPGAVGAALTLPLTTEMIVDGEHLHPQVVRLICNVKKPWERVLVTDAMRAAGLGNCESELGGQKVIVKDGRATLEGGVLAGSVLDLNTALKNTMLFTGLPLIEIIEMLTVNPARILGVNERKGEIKAGFDADLVILNEHLAVERSFVHGQMAYSLD